jgi:hypothetical protein
MPRASDKAFWSFEILLDWLRRRAGAANDTNSIERFRKSAIVEIKELASAERLVLTGCRCRVEFNPSRIVALSWLTEVIPSPQFHQCEIRPVLGHWVLTPPVMYRVADLDTVLRDIPEALQVLVKRSIDSMPFPIVEPGTPFSIEGWSNLHVRSADVRDFWRDADPASADYEAVKVYVKAHGQVPVEALWRSARTAFAGKKIPRKWVRDASREVWGPPKRGRPSAG